MISGKPTVTGGNRKQSDIIPIISPEDRHCHAEVKPFLNRDRAILDPSTNENNTEEKKWSQSKTSRVIAI